MAIMSGLKKAWKYIGNSVTLKEKEAKEAKLPTRLTEAKGEAQVGSLASNSARAP